MNSAAFNLVQALPVMPGPCQLLDWQKMKEMEVVDHYFSMMFNGKFFVCYIFVTAFYVFVLK